MNADRRAGIGISSSVLNMCPRQHILAKRNDYYEAPADFYARWRGSFGHFAIEMGGPYPGVVQERRFYRSIDVDGMPFPISGQPDWVDISRRHISDAKFLARAPQKPYQDHENQVNVYAWLVEGGYTERWQDCPGETNNPIPAGWQAETAEIVYMDARGETMHPVPLWTDDARERFITERLRPHKQYAETGSLAGIGITNPDDRWKAKYCPFAASCNPGTCCISRS